MLRSIVQLALLVRFCMAASHTQDVAKPAKRPWCMNTKTKILHMKDLQLPNGDCDVVTDDLTGVVTYESNKQWERDSPCLKNYFHVACEMYPATPKFDPVVGKDVCILENNDGSYWPVDIQVHQDSPDSLVVFAEHKGGASCDEPFTGIWLIAAENTNAVDISKVIGNLSNGTERILFVAEGNHLDKVQTHLAQMQPKPMFAHVIEYTEHRPQALYNTLLEFLASGPENPVKKVIWVLQPGTVPNPKMLQRVAALLKQDTEVVKEWFNDTCTLGDYETPELCQEHRVNSWRLYRTVTWGRCPTDQNQTVEDLFLNFKKMNPLVQKVSNLLAGCDHHGLDSRLHKQLVQAIGCAREYPPRCPNEGGNSMRCKVRQLEYYNSMICAGTFLLVAIVVAIVAFVYKKFPHLLDRKMVEKASKDAAEGMTRVLMRAGEGVHGPSRNR